MITVIGLLGAYGFWIVILHDLAVLWEAGMVKFSRACYNCADRWARNRCYTYQYSCLAGGVARLLIISATFFHFAALSHPFAFIVMNELVG